MMTSIAEVEHQETPEYATPIPPWARRLRPTRQEATAFLFLFPLLALLAVFLIYPTLTSLVQAFQEYSLGGVEPNRWVGLRNYVRMVGEWRFWNSMRVTLTYALGMVFIPYSLALPLALFMNMKIPGRAVFRTLFFLPVVTPISAAGLVFVYLFNTDFGIVNSALLSLDLVQKPISWLGSAPTAIAATLAMIVWGQAGFSAVTLLTGLQVITQDIVEAASIDGASGWSLFRHITLPMLKPTSIVVITFSLVNTFKMFGEIYVMTRGGPAKGTEVVGLYLYQNAFHYWRLGYASAIGTVILVICLVVNAVMARIGRVDWQ